MDLQADSKGLTDGGHVRMSSVCHADMWRLVLVGKVTVHQEQVFVRVGWTEEERNKHKILLRSRKPKQRELLHHQGIQACPHDSSLTDTQETPT